RARARVARVAGADPAGPGREIGRLVSLPGAARSRRRQHFAGAFRHGRARAHHLAGGAARPARQPRRRRRARAPARRRRRAPRPPHLYRAGRGAPLARGAFRPPHRAGDRAVTVWLKARPEDHWNRVIQQGDQRPMASHPHAMAELRALLTARERLYAEAEHVIDTSRLAVDAAVERLTRELGPTAAP